MIKASIKRGLSVGGVSDGFNGFQVDAGRQSRIF
jgi:hypothetical protein